MSRTQNVRMNPFNIFAHIEDVNNKTVYLTDIHYIFEDDDPTTLMEITQHAENIVIVDVDNSLNINNIEIVSDKVQLLSYTSINDEINMHLLSQFDNSIFYNNDTNLVELINIYRKRNEELNSILNDL